MPYKSKAKDRLWHKRYMRYTRFKNKQNQAQLNKNQLQFNTKNIVNSVTPVVTKKSSNIVTPKIKKVIGKKQVPCKDRKHRLITILQGGETVETPPEYREW